MRQSHLEQERTHGDAAVEKVVEIFLAKKVVSSTLDVGRLDETRFQKYLGLNGIKDFISNFYETF